MLETYGRLWVLVSGFLGAYFGAPVVVCNEAVVLACGRVFSSLFQYQTSRRSEDGGTVGVRDIIGPHQYGSNMLESRQEAVCIVERRVRDG